MKKLIFACLFAFLSLNLVAQDISIELFKGGFSNPLDIQNAGDDRLFVVEKGGRIKILNPDTSVNPTPFLNISTLVSTNGERGLLGLAFHPNYTTNGYFYVNYTKTDGNTRVARYSVDPNDPDLADAGSELTIIEYNQPASNHNGGALAFRSDGFLYISSGDGGGSSSTAQNTTLLLGKMLRLDVDNPSGGNNYGIPADNPFAGSTVDAEEIWAYGLRNPFRFSFDSLTDDIWIGDVGAQDIEEIDRSTASEAGLNYGWPCYEGSMPYNTTNCPPIGELTFPVAEYSSSSGTGNCSISGGYVYRGSVYTDIEGLYFFADFCSGLIGTVDSDGNLIDHGDFNGSWVCFGVDASEELYISDFNGSIYKVKGSVVAGVSEFDAMSVRMFPNPASDEITISIDNDRIASAMITDIKGSVLLKETQIASEVSLNVSQLYSGLYLVQITSENGNNTVKKLVIE